MLLYLSWCWCWCWCVLEMWRNCLAAGAGAGGEISGNGTMAARQPGSSPVRGHCQGGSRLEHHHLRFIARTNQSPAAATSPPTRGEKLWCLCWAGLVMVGPTPTSTWSHCTLAPSVYNTTYYNNTIFDLRSLKSPLQIFFFTESSLMA